MSRFFKKQQAMKYNLSSRQQQLLNNSDQWCLTSFLTAIDQTDGKPERERDKRQETESREREKDR